MLIATTSEIGAPVLGAIREAAQATGTGFEYLLQTAMRESRFKSSIQIPLTFAW